MGILNKMFGKSENKEPKSQESNINAKNYKDFAKNGIFVFLIPNTSYQEELVGITKSFADKFGKVLYVSINRPAEKVSEIFKQNKINTEKFLFIDSTSKSSIK